MNRKDLRGFLATLEQHNLLRRVTRTVSADHEAAALIKKTDGKIPLYFEHIDHYATPLVAGLGGTRQTLALNLGVKPEDLVARLASAIVNPIPPTQVTQANVQQNVVNAPFDLDAYFPVLRYSDRDPGRFLVSGVMTATDINGVKTYTSIRRMQYLGGNRCCLLVTSHDMKQQIRYYESRRQPMEIAVMFGVNPAVILASQISTHTYNVDKLAVTGALLDQALEVVRAKTVDINVLADAEMVLEGHLYPWIKETEGPFGELAGYYGGVSQQPVVEFSAMTFRNHPITQTILAGSCEEKLPEAIAREVTLLAAVRQTVPGVTAVHISLAAVGRFHAVIQLDKTSPGDGKQAVLAAFSADKDLKHAVAVDVDVDLFSAQDVEWAIATRVQADIDVFIIPGANGSPLEPSHLERGMTAKMGIDATCPLGNAAYRRVSIPGEAEMNISDYIHD
ncbi:UbiD family decarboxylase [Brenneria sp. 4F2]|nr:UbiD family decarboxylase [Brenneria bubanii]